MAEFNAQSGITVAYDLPLAAYSSVPSALNVLPEVSGRVHIAWLYGKRIAVSRPFIERHNYRVVTIGEPDIGGRISAVIIATGSPLSETVALALSSS